MLRLPPSVALALVVSATGCGSADEPAPFDDGRAASSSDSQLGTRRVAYPDPPYGTKQGAVIANQEWLGWHDPGQTGYDTSAFEKISLADYYDPSGARGIGHIVLTSTAVWCSVCRAEYQDLANGQVQKWNDRGVVFIGALFEDNDGNPAGPDELRTWAQTFDVAFPFVLDPGFKLGAFFSREATPMTMIIDASTMEIVWQTEGWAPEGSGQSVWDVLAQLQ